MIIHHHPHGGRDEFCVILMKTSESITVAIPVRKIAPGIGKFMGRTRRRQGSPKTERKADGNQLSEGGNRRRGGTAGGGSPTTSKFER